MVFSVVDPLLRSNDDDSIVTAMAMMTTMRTTTTTMKIMMMMMMMRRRRRNHYGILTYIYIIDNFSSSNTFICLFISLAVVVFTIVTVCCFYFSVKPHVH